VAQARRRGEGGAVESEPRRPARASDAHEAALRAADERFRLATEALAGFLYDWNPATNDLEWFGGMEEVLGFSLADVAPDVAWYEARMHPDDLPQAEAVVQAAFESGAPGYSNVYRCLHRDGHYVHVADRARIVRDDAGQPVRVLGGVSDISERVTLLEREHQARAAAEDATRARDVVLGVVSHDLGNSLGAIALCVTALLERPEPSAESVQKILEAIRHSAESAGRLIRDLSDVASIEAGRLAVEPYDEVPDVILTQAAEMFAAAASDRGVALETRSTPGLPAVHADGERVVQGLANLVTNSLKFTEPGGRITLSAEPDPAGVRFRVEDTGVGIAPEDLPYVFDRYWQRHREGGQRGSGLGLAIVRGIVDAHGGQISVESTPGKGSQFSFTIPISDYKAAIRHLSETPAASAQPSGS